MLYSTRGVYMVEQLKLELGDNSLQLVLELTGNPWTDFGIVSFFKDLQSIPFSCDVTKTPQTASITIDTVNLEKFEEWLNQKLMERWNRLYWLSRGAKILENTKLNYDDQGFIDSDNQLIPVSDDDRILIKEKWKNSTVKDNVSRIQMRFNFIGIGNSAKKFKSELQKNIQDFIQDWQIGDGKKVCDMSGRSCSKTKDLLQVVNPIANKHHNTKARGFYGSAVVPKVGPVYYLLSLSATLDENIPFVYNPANQSIKLILPEINNLELLAKVHERLNDNLRDDLRQKELYPYTNLRTQIRVSNQYSLAISLFHNIFYEFTPADDDDETDGEWNFSPLVEDSTKSVSQLTRWVIIPYVKGQVVTFQNFHTVEVDARLYDFVKPIDFKPKSIKLVLDLLVRMSSRTPDGENAIGQFCQAIATSTHALMKVALYSLWKHQKAVLISPQRGAPHPVRLLQPFVNHFLEVNQVLDAELREDLRALGTTIGKTFYKDVTLITKLYNVSSVNAFREALSVVMLRLYKYSTGEGVKNAVPVKQERVDHILNELTDKNYKEIAETLSTYVCLNAYNNKVFESKSNSDGGNQNE